MIGVAQDGARAFVRRACACRCPGVFLPKHFQYFEADLMASTNLDRLRKEILQLTPAERAELAHDLVVSLDAPTEPDAATAWEAEILDRLDTIDSDTGVLIDRDEMRRRMRARLNSG